MGGERASGRVRARRTQNPIAPTPPPAGACPAGPGRGPGRCQRGRRRACAQRKPSRRKLDHAPAKGEARGPHAALPQRALLAPEGGVVAAHAGRAAVVRGDDEERVVVPAQGANACSGPPELCSFSPCACGDRFFPLPTLGRAAAAGRDEEERVVIAAKAGGASEGSRTVFSPPRTPPHAWHAPPLVGRGDAEPAAVAAAPVGQKLLSPRETGLAGDGRAGPT